jgi:hypothetical protein
MGRKSIKDEIKVVKYMTELAPRTFLLIREYLEREPGEDSSDETRRMIKSDRKWAMEQMMKLYAKAVPVAGDDPENPIYTAQITGMRIVDESNVGTTEDRDRVSEQEPETNPSS